MPKQDLTNSLYLIYTQLCSSTQVHIQHVFNHILDSQATLQLSWSHSVVVLCQEYFIVILHVTIYFNYTQCSTTRVHIADEVADYISQQPYAS